LQTFFVHLLQKFIRVNLASVQVTIRVVIKDEAATAHRRDPESRARLRIIRRGRERTTRFGQYHPTAALECWVTVEDTSTWSVGCA
jgi:hypothetical protein